MKIFKECLKIIAIILFAVLAAINYIIFVFPNSFAPAGVDGICTMIQDVTRVNMGYLSLLVNIPLLIIAFRLLNRRFSFNTFIYVLSFSTAVILLKDAPISRFIYHTESGTSIILAPVAAGTIRGILYYFTLKLNCCGGGTDIVAAYIKKFKPYFNLMNVIFFLNMIIAFSSYFVYGMKIEPVICSIIYSFITSTVSKQIQSDKDETVKFEIIASDAHKLCEEISHNLHLRATVVGAQGAFSGNEKEMIICVVDKKEVPLLEALLPQFSDIVVFKSITNSSRTLTDYSKSGV